LKACAVSEIGFGHARLLLHLPGRDYSGGKRLGNAGKKAMLHATSRRKTPEIPGKPGRKPASS
jgi:hypothetical protein